MIGENQFILVTGGPGTSEPRTLVRIDADADEQFPILRMRDTRRCIGEGLIMRGSRWWYSRCSGFGVQFVTSDAPGSSSFVANDSALDPREWLPFEQDDPGGVLLSVEKDERTVVASAVTPSGIQETLGRFDRGSAIYGDRPGQAVRLGKDRVALVTIETTSPSYPAHSTIVLRVIQNSEIATWRVAFDESGWSSVAAAMGPNGELAIVAAPFDDRGPVAMVVDLTQADDVVTRRLAGTTAGSYPALRLMVNGDRFIASWIRAPDGAVQIAEFNEGIALPPATLADHAGILTPALGLGHAPGDEPREIAVFWTEDGGNLMLRRLPQPPGGFLIASDLLRMFSNWAARQVQQVRLVAKRL
jgi:hypothetical protein